MNNKNKRTDLQFTKLTPNDIGAHRDLYTTACLALHFEYLPKEYFEVYYTHAKQELQKAVDSFHKTFK